MLSAGMSSTDSINSASQRSWPLRTGRERDAAVAEHDRRDAVPARRRRVGVPCQLRVEMGVHVDKAGCDVRAASRRSRAFRPRRRFRSP